MSRTRRILGGTGVAYAHQAVVVLVGLWLTPFLLHRLGQQQLGLWLVAGQVLGYMALMDLGVIAMLPREVAFASGQGGQEGERVGALVRQVQRIVRWQVVALAAVAAALWWFLPTDWSALKWPLAIVLVSFVVLYPTRVAAAALQGAQDLTFLAFAQMVAWALSTVTTVVLVLAGWSMYALVLGWVVLMLVPALAAVYRARQRWPSSAVSTTEDSSVRHYFSRSMWVSVSQISQVLLNGSDVLLLGRILGAAAVVPYTCTGKLVTVFANHPQLLMHAAQPALSELRGSATRERLATVTTALTQAMLIMSGGIAVLILPVNQMFVSWWVGPGQYGGWWLTAALAAMMLLRHCNVAITYTLFCFGYERQISLTGLMDGVVSVVGTALLVWKFGPIGAPLASIVGVVVVSLPRNLISVARELKLTPAQFVMRLSPVIGRIIGVGAASAFVAGLVPHGSFLPTLLTAAITGSVYAALVLPMAWNGPIGPYLRLAFQTFRSDGENTRLDRWLVRLAGAKQT